MQPDKEQVMSRWAKGHTAATIGKALNVRREIISVIVQRARANGDGRAHSRRPGRQPTLAFTVSTDVVGMIADEADRRDMNERDLLSKLVELAFRDGIVGAILDQDEVA